MVTMKIEVSIGERDADEVIGGRGVFCLLGLMIETHPHSLQYYQ